jgi:predicted permease
MRLWRRKAREQELERELLAHLELEAEEQQEAGLSSEESRYAARRAFGNLGTVKESVRETWGGTLFETLGQDLRYAVRSLRANLAFVLVAVGSLGLGIGANTAIFSFVNALLLKHLPVPEPTRLVELAEYNGAEETNSAFSYPFIAELDKRNRAFDGILARFPVRVNLTSDGVSEPLHGEVVTGNYFNTLQIQPAIGRLLTANDIEASTGDPLCVISYATWQQRFASDPRIVGRKLLLNAHPYTVIGVTQKGFYGSQLQSRIDLQLPVSRMGDFMGGFFASGPGGTMWKSPGFNWLQPLARLKPNLTPARAQAMLNPIAHAIALQLAGPNQLDRTGGAKITYRLTDGSQGIESNSVYAQPVAVLMGIVTLVLLIACANIANLLLARAIARAKEFAVRLSLGASRWRLIRQLMVETLVLAGCGGLSGLTLAFWIVHTLLTYLNAGQAAGEGLHVAVDPLVIGFSVLLSFLTALLFGLVPAWQSAQPDIVPELKGTPRASAHAGPFQLRRLLIVFQIALSLMILFAAGLLTRTLSGLKTIDLGFDPARVVTLKIDPAMNGYSPDQTARLFDEVLARLHRLPGTEAASLAVVTPLEGSMISLNFTVPGHAQKSSDVQTNFNMISPEFFKTLNQPLLAGRDFSNLDAAKAPHVAIVNQKFAAQFMPGQNPLGRHFQVGRVDTEIVGLVKNSRYQTLREQTWPLVYLPAKQTESSGYSLLIRTRSPSPAAIAGIRRTIRSIDSKLPIYEVRQLQDEIDQGMSSERVLSFLSSLFGAFATLLSAMGIYGLIAFAVSRRTREIGLRFAIGAQKMDVAKLFLRESLLLVAAGILAGIPLAFAATRVLTSLLYDVAPRDPATLSLAVLIFLVAGLLASVLPVLRAARIDPIRALRYE